MPAHTNRALEATIWLEENTGSKRRRRRTHLGNFLAQRGLGDGVELGVADGFDLQGSVTRGERIKARKEGKRSWRLHELDMKLGKVLTVMKELQDGSAMWSSLEEIRAVALGLKA